MGGCASKRSVGIGIRPIESLEPPKEDKDIYYNSKLAAVRPIMVSQMETSPRVAEINKRFGI